MRSVHVTRTIPGPPEPIFDRLTDHANYDRFRGINGSELVREGDPAPNGVGALRRGKGRAPPLPRGRNPPPPPPPPPPPIPETKPPPPAPPRPPPPPPPGGGGRRGGGSPPPPPP